ncbi:hypothetical protein H2204_008833 [Knufia peltigerae]|uniref:Uncharacterized protein n=1 Tax=Knufia peltigerae TaxID=1002370 RepID=A0AA38Y0A1_9EURO|nr:hypothetical protein H2204_008833 [Knufia peltigerae]
MKDALLELQASAPAFTHVGEVLEKPGEVLEKPGEVLEKPGEVLEQHADIAPNFVQQHEDTCYARQEEKAVLRKIALTLMPLMFVSYMIQYMDKSILGQSAVYGFSTSLGLKGHDYSWYG